MNSSKGKSLYILRIYYNSCSIRKMLNWEAHTKVTLVNDSLSLYTKRLCSEHWTTYYLINLTHVPMKIGIFKQLLLCAFEQDIVDKIKPNQSSKQANIGKSQCISTQVPWATQVIIYHVQLTKQIIHRSIICLLTLSKSTSMIPIKKLQKISSFIKQRIKKIITYKLHYSHWGRWFCSTPQSSPSTPPVQDPNPDYGPTCLNPN